MPRLFIHAGPSKTGSTTLQSALIDPRADLGGWIYPDIGRTRGDSGQHNVFYEAARPRRYQPHVSGTAAFTAMLDQGRDIILSSEDTPLWPGGLKAVIAPALQRGYAVEVLVFVRDPVERLNSIYTQQIKTLAINEDFATFLENLPDSPVMYPFTRAAANIERAGARPILMPFLPGAMDRIYDRVQQILGVTLPLDAGEVRNPSPSYYEIALYRALGDSLRGVNYWSAVKRGAERFGDGRKFFGFDDALFEKVKTAHAGEYSAENCAKLDCLGAEFHAALFATDKRFDPRIDTERLAAYVGYVRTELGLDARASAPDGPPTRHEALRPDRLAAPPGRQAAGVALPEGVRLVFTSALAGHRPDGTLPEGADAQARQSLANILAVLAEAGLGAGNILRLDIRLSDRAHLAEVLAARDAALAGVEPPCAASVSIVAGFREPAILVEIEAIAAG